MPSPQKHPLRAFTQQETQALSHITKADSERADTVRRAKALVAVSQGAPFAQAARQSGFKSADSVSQLVQRFNLKSFAALFIATGRGRKPTDTSHERQYILEEVHREPNREQDQSATWSLKLLERALRKRTLPAIGASTIRRVLHESGYAFGRSRTWCQTGTALRVRKTGGVKVYDPQAEAKQR